MNMEVFTHITSILSLGLLLSLKEVATAGG